MKPGCPSHRDVPPVPKREMDTDLKAKERASDLVQDALLQAHRDLWRFAPSARRPQGNTVRMPGPRAGQVDPLLFLESRWRDKPDAFVLGSCSPLRCRGESPRFSGGFRA
jgi:hypothetical protein